MSMQRMILEHMRKDLEDLKRNVSIIIQILSEEGELTENVRMRLKRARETPDSEYIKLD